MRKFLVIVFITFFVSAGNLRADNGCLGVSYVEKPGPNFTIFLETLEGFLENLCPHGEAQDLIDFEFGAKKGEFEVSISSVPPDCPTFGVVGDLTCDPHGLPRCYSVGKFVLAPNPEAAKKLGQRVAEKINNGNWTDVGCDYDAAD